MANPNPQLVAALAQFAAQPGTTPDQEAQLRAAVIADASRLNLLNQQATSGQLKGFALETPGGAPNLTGSYDKATGVVTIPAASFQPGGSAASSDLKAVVGLQVITVDFGHKTWQDPAGLTQTVSQDMVANLQSSLNGSPVLAAQIKDAVTQGHVQHFSLLGNSMAAGATYDGQEANAHDPTPKGINLPPLGLQTKTAANPQGKYDPIDMTFVLGHEIQHGFNDAAKDQATRTFMQSINSQIQVQGPVHDYTDELRAYIQAGREDEAKAEIAGWNALLSREQQSVPNASLDHMLFTTRNDRVRDFVAQHPNVATLQAVAKPGLTFNQDNSLSQTPGNIAAMGQHYFDRPSPVHAQPNQRPVGLGEHKPNPTADYTNFYGTWALERIVAAEDQSNVQYQGAKPQIAINMSSIGLKEDLIEMEGMDLGANKAPRPYLDTSQTPPAPHHFDHTQDGSVSSQQDHQHVPIAPFAPSLSPDRYRENGAQHEERFRKADEARDPRNVGKPGMRENDGAQAEPSISLGSPHRDRAYAALKAGDSDEVGRIAVEFAQSPRGQELIERGNQLLAQQQAQELQQLLEQNRQLEQQRESERQRSGPVMTLMQPSPHHHH